MTRQAALRLFLAGIVAISIQHLVSAQTSVNTSAQSSVAAQAVPVPSLPVLPSNPADILTLARRYNGLGDAALSPWHVRVAYETFDEAGNAKDNGVFEEFWESPKLYKRTFSSSSFTWTEYGTSKGLYRKGEASYVPYPLNMMDTVLLNPIPPAFVVSSMNPLLRQQKSGEAELQCVMLMPKSVPVTNVPLAVFPTFCFGENRPLLRIATQNGGHQVMFNSVLLFHDHFVAKDAVVETKGKLALKVRLEEIEALTDTPLSDFVPPPDAVLVPPSVPGAVMSGMLLSEVKPVYPPIDKTIRASGIVILNATIGRDGTVKDVQVMVAPDRSMADAAMDAVRRWRYKPYLLNGEPVEVETQVTVTFNLGSGR